MYEACLARAWRLSDAVLPQLRRATDAATGLAAAGEAAKTERRRCEQLTAAAEAEVTQANLRLSKFRRERAQSEVALLAAHAKGQRLEEALAEARGDSARLVKAAEAAGLELQVLLPLPSLQVLFVAPPCGCLCPPPPLELQEAGWQHERHESTIAATQHEADEAAKALERLQKRWANDCAMLEKVDDELAQARLVHTNTHTNTRHPPLPPPYTHPHVSLSLNSLSLSQRSQLPTNRRASRLRSSSRSGGCRRTRRSGSRARSASCASRCGGPLRTPWPPSSRRAPRPPALTRP